MNDITLIHKYLCKKGIDNSLTGFYMLAYLINECLPLNNYSSSNIYKLENNVAKMFDTTIKNIDTRIVYLFKKSNINTTKSKFIANACMELKELYGEEIGETSQKSRE